ncbi:MAG TPA: class I adenylate-forming enzyme family protein [Verrucomicrobiae bacterium]|nr:class I adenylate-forming enzyme family protein [Verrucomicrobiae bacterium]
MTSERVDDLIRSFAATTPGAEAMVLGDRRWSYSTLAHEVDALARALLASGVERGDRVATLSTPHPDFLIAFLATASIGAIWVGLNPRYKLSELAYVLNDAEPRVLLARTRIEDRDYREDLTTLVGDCPSLQRVAILNNDPLFEGAEAYAAFVERGAVTSDDGLSGARAATGGRDPCMIVYTSGSTGRPKGALLCHEGICEFSRAQNALWPVSPARILNYFPINHIGCVIDVTCPVLAVGGAVIFLEQFDTREAMRLAADEKCTLWGSVPSVLQMQLALPDFDAFDLSAVQLILWEGAAIPADVLDRLMALGPPLATNYGMTEATSAITALAPTRDRDRLLNSVGPAFPGVEVKLMRSDGGEANLGEEGEVWARSSWNMLGYWRRPEATAETLTPDGWLRTGDVAVKRADNCYRIVGRIKEMYKSGGYNVYPREVEDTLEMHPAVALAAVVSVRDPLWGESGIAFLLCKTPVDIASLDAHCRANLANYKAPKRIILRDALPLLPNGKVDKLALRKEAEALTPIASAES